MEIHENKKDNIISCFKWLDDYIEVLGIKPKQLRKKEQTKKSKKT
jgi:hypothetical protein